MTGHLPESTNPNKQPEGGLSQRLKPPTLSLGLLAMLLGACGDTASTEPAATNRAEARSPAPAASGTAAALPTRAISADDAFGRTPPVLVRPGPCPFLSDETAIATARANRSAPLSRKGVSNTECRWSYSAGFSVIVKVQAVDEATPASERRYNLGSDPLIVRHAGPGENAMVLKDDTWETARPYAFGFEQDGRSVSIQVIGLQTSIDQLLATANEVASKLPIAPEVEPSRYEERPALSACSVWDERGLLSVFKFEAADTISISGSGEICRFSFFHQDPPGVGPKITLQFMTHDEPAAELLSRHGAERVGGHEVPIFRRVVTDQFGTTTTVSGPMGHDEIAVTIVDSGSVKRDREGLKLLENLLSRLSG